MKKIIAILIVGMVTLTGCSFSISTEKEKETVCNYENGIKTIMITSTSKGNVIITETYVTTDDFSDYDDREDILENVEEYYEEASEKYDVDGVDYSYEIKNYVATETIKVTYDKLNVKDGLELDLLSGVDKDETNFEAKLDQSTSTREEKGFSCKEK